MPDSRLLTCDGPPPAALLAGIEQFNQGAYFECHETLEAIWMREPGDIRRLYQGILQIGVGFYHLQRGNYRGALNLLASGVAYLEPFAPYCQGVILDPLLAATRAIRREVLALGPARLHEIAPTRLPRITVQAPLLVAAPVPPPARPADAPGHW
jgi:predicted metal-dependent hydrolase